MPRKQHSHHYIYKTTCTVTGRYYIGMHSTSNLEDDYIGSGKRLWLSIRKHGLENHVREIIEFLSDRKTLVAREKEIVNEDLLQDPMCMNLMQGGEGGKQSDENVHKWVSAGGKKSGRKNLEKIMLDPEIKKKHTQSVCDTFMKKYGSRNPWKGRQHMEEYKRKISEANKISQKGEKNSQFGTCWVTKDEKNLRIKKEELIHYLSIGWKKGRVKCNGNK